MLYRFAQAILADRYSQLSEQLATSEAFHGECDVLSSSLHLQKIHG